MNELFLYDRDEGLFKAILSQSTVLQGRYFILSDGSDMNKSQFGTYISDALNGMQAAGQKYPVCLCLPPRSLPDSTSEVFAFTLFFLTRSGATGQNRIKDIDTDTQASTHHAWYDWKDMAECAKNFLFAVNKLLRTSYSGSVKIGSMFNVQPEGRSITRISNIGNDNVSGVRLDFRVEMNAECEAPDYEDLTLVEIPSLNIHPLHKH